MTLANIRDIEIIRSLAEHRHFGRAATALGISQPAVSRALAQIEAEIGEPLIERNSVRPTIFGQIVLRHADRVLSGFAAIHREIAMLRGLEVGEIVVAMGPYPAAISGQLAVAKLSQRYPRLSIDMRVMNWVDAIEASLEGRVDLAFADLQEARGNRDLEIQPVRKGTLTFFCRAGHVLAGRTGVTLQDCMDFPWTGPTVPGRIGRGLPSEDKPYGFFDTVRQRFKPRIAAETFHAMKEIAKASDAIAAALPFMIDTEVAAGEVAALLEVPFLYLDYGFVWRKGMALSPAAKAFIETVMEIERGHPPTSARLEAEAS